MIQKRISSIKGISSESLIETENHRKFLENFESDLLRGIGKICILKVIKKHGKTGVYGYQLLKDLKEETNDMLIIKEGTLYPLLRNLEKWGSKDNKLSLIKSYKKIEHDRPRKYYVLTDEGDKILSHLEGFFSKLLEAIAVLNDFKIILNDEKFIFCPYCKNKIDYSDKNISFCEVCGHNLHEQEHEV